MKSNLILVAVIVAVVAGGAGFFGGMKYQQSKSPSFSGNAQFGGGNRPGGGRFGGNGANRPITGNITSSDSKSMTVQLQDGSSKIVLITGSTSINKAATGTTSDLTVGTRVAAFGATNSDGSITAQNIQINPIMRQSNETPSPTP